MKKSKTTTKPKTNIKEEITKKIISSIQEGTIPWERPWNALAGLPMNAVHKNPYKGGNILLLWLMSTINDYATDRWLTFNQIKTLAGFEWNNVKKGFVWPDGDVPEDVFHLRAGEKASVIMTPFMVKKLDKDKKPVIDPKTNKPEMVCIGFKGLPVFNLNQCNHIPKNLLKEEFFEKGTDSINALNQL
jgi:antirestriction protein ArdC